MPNLIDLLRDDDRAALVPLSGPPVSFSELRARVARFAGGLWDEGLRPGDRVVLLLPMGVDLYVALLALFHVGATAVLIDPAGPVEANLRKASPVAFIGTAKAHLLRLKVPALRGLAMYISDGFTPLPHRRMSGVAGASPPISAGAHPALITFTTGTTGLPKAMARSHAFLVAQHRALSHHMDLGPGDVDLPTLAVFLLHSLAGGATCVLPDADLRRPDAVDPARLVAQMARRGVTVSSGSPAFFAPIARHLNATGQSLPGVTRLFLGGARVPAPLVAEMKRAFPRATISVVYGSTEAEPIAVLDAGAAVDELLHAERTGQGALVGSPVPDILLRIVDDEVQVAGEHVNPAYFNDDAATTENKLPERLADGTTRIWHRTGDAGRLDDDGRVWLRGRVGDQIAGLWPLEVEGAAEQFDFVRRAGLAERGGQPVVACALHRPPPDWAAQVHQATGCTPVHVDYVPVDPRHNAKIDRSALTQMLRT